MSSPNHNAARAIERAIGINTPREIRTKIGMAFTKVAVYLMADEFSLNETAHALGLGSHTSVLYNRKVTGADFPCECGECAVCVVRDAYRLQRRGEDASVRYRPDQLIALASELVRSKGQRVIAASYLPNGRSRDRDYLRGKYNRGEPLYPVEIAALFGLNPASVRSMCSSAERKFRDEFAKRHPELVLEFIQQ